MNKIIEKEVIRFKNEDINSENYDRFYANSQLELWAKENGYSIGSSQRYDPRALVHISTTNNSFVCLPKWRYWEDIPELGFGKAVYTSKDQISVILYVIEGQHE